VLVHNAAVLSRPVVMIFLVLSVCVKRNEEGEFDTQKEGVKVRVGVQREREGAECGREGKKGKIR
jgi:hypothetical protein